MAVLFALLSSFFIGMNTILVKKSLSRAKPYTVAAVLTFIGTVFFWLLALITWTSDSFLENYSAVLFFFIAGIFAPALVRWFYFASVHRVGPSISSAILATIPAFSAVIAILFLNEAMSWILSLGMSMIVGGIIFFERDMNGHASDRNLRRTDLALPVLASIAAAIAINLRKLGLQELNSPILAAAVGFGSASIVYLAGLLLSPRLPKRFKALFAGFADSFTGRLFPCSGMVVHTVCTLLRAGSPGIAFGQSSPSCRFDSQCAFSQGRRNRKITARILIGSGSVLLGVILVTNGLPPLAPYEQSPSEDS